MKKIVWPEDRILYDMYDKNRSCRKIAEILGANAGSVYYKLKKIGVKVMNARDGGRHSSSLNRGRKQSLESREKMSRSKKALYAHGEPGPMTGKHHSPETRLLISKIQTGRKLSEETKKKLSNATIGIPKPWAQGSNHPLWTGGHSIKYGRTFNISLKNYIRSLSNDRCAVCGGEDVKELSNHHIDYNKFNDGVGNLVALCQSCHTHTNHDRTAWLMYFTAPVLDGFVNVH